MPELLSALLSFPLNGDVALIPMGGDVHVAVSCDLSPLWGPGPGVGLLLSVKGTGCWLCSTLRHCHTLSPSLGLSFLFCKMRGWKLLPLTPPDLPGQPQLLPQNQG